MLEQGDEGGKPGRQRRRPPPPPPPARRCARARPAVSALCLLDGVPLARRASAQRRADARGAHDGAGVPPAHLRARGAPPHPGKRAWGWLVRFLLRQPPRCPCESCVQTFAALVPPSARKGAVKAEVDDGTSGARCATTRRAARRRRAQRLGDGQLKVPLALATADGKAVAILGDDSALLPDRSVRDRNGSSPRSSAAEGGWHAVTSAAVRPPRRPHRRRARAPSARRGSTPCRPMRPLRRRRGARGGEGGGEGGGGG